MTTPSAAGPTAVATGAAGADHGTSGPSAGGGFAGVSRRRDPADRSGRDDPRRPGGGSGGAAARARAVSATGTRAVSASGSGAGAASGGCAAGSGGGSPSGVCQLISVSLVRCPSILAARRGSQADREPAEALGDEQDAEQHEQRRRDDSGSSAPEVACRATGRHRWRWRPRRSSPPSTRATSRSLPRGSPG